MRRDLAALEDRHFDLVVIGGGIVGACVLRDAARRGLSAALVEADDFACGASEAMSHFIHGGIRYLAEGRIGMVRRSLAERGIWQRIAPQFVAPQPFLLPFEKGRSSITLRLGTALFEMLGGKGFGRRLGPDEAAAAEPVLEGMGGALLYQDCRIDAPERAVIAILKDAEAHGAAIANHAEAVSLAANKGRVTGLAVRDGLGGGLIHIRAKAVLNATGAAAQFVAEKLAPGQKQVRLTLSKGIHLVTRPLLQTHALAFSGRGEHAALSPWQGMTLIGTTDFVHNGDPRLADAEAVAALTGKVRRFLPAISDALSDPLEAFAGVRALPGQGGDTYRAARETLFADHAGDGAAGLFTLTGGKWTTARHMAETGVDRISAFLGLKLAQCDTMHAVLPDAINPLATEVQRFEAAADSEMAMTADDLARRMTRAACISDPGLRQRAAAWLETGGKAGQAGP